jgi:hypothetical protein
MLFYSNRHSNSDRHYLQHLRLEIFPLSVSPKIKQWAKPATLSLISGVISDMNRSRFDLIVENALLRQQLIVLHLQMKRPLLTQHDRFRLVLLARFTRFWKQTPNIVGSNHSVEVGNQKKHPSESLLPVNRTDF